MGNDENIPVEKCECEVVDNEVRKTTKTFFVDIDSFLNLNKQIIECCCNLTHYNK